jgi:hypothetical protein
MSDLYGKLFVVWECLFCEVISDYYYYYYYYCCSYCGITSLFQAIACYVTLVHLVSTPSAPIFE